jgi:2-phospho-L-lactate transferase/gluconeogenesis factor (CofD/UPF0052 family)
MNRYDNKSGSGKRGVALSHQFHRYFLDVLPSHVDRSVTRAEEEAVRKSSGQHFIALIKNWLADHHLNGSVQRLDLTTFGYVHITCTPEVIDAIRHQDIVPIGSIRPAANISLF